jgi:AcrR family transcriptional regulator
MRSGNPQKPRPRPVSDTRAPAVQERNRAGAKDPAPADRRVQRTRRTLREALIALMMERGWDAVSVQDVCDRADVGRSTFYTHFADKEELLIGGLDDLRKALLARPAPPEGGAAPLGFARGMIEHVHENQRLFLALVGKSGGQVVLRRFKEMVVELVRDDLRAAVSLRGPFPDATVHFLTGAFLEVLVWWLESRAPLRPPEVERLFLQMATPVLQAARAERE